MSYPASRYISSSAARQQSGMVIVVALFIVALVATMAYVMVARVERDTRRTMLIVRNTQAEYEAQGSIAWAIDVLRNNWERRVPNKPVDQFPLTSPVMKEGRYQIVSTIYDMQARYNLNNVSKVETQQDFIRLLQAVLPKLPHQQAQQITRALVDWIMPASEKSVFAEYYLNLPMPYRAPHKPMASASELRLVKGVTAEIYQALQPYVTALPPPTQLNVQTMSAPAMVTLSTTMSLQAANAVENLRRTMPLPTTQAFLNLDVIKNHHVEANKVTAISQYFLVETKVSIEKQQAVIYTLLMRSTKDQKTAISIVWQSKGTW